MINLLKGSLGLIQALALAAVAPMVALRRADGKWQRWRVIAVHAVTVVLGVVALAVLQNRFQLDALVRSSLPVVRFTWLPLVGTLLYATAWSAWFVARTLRMPTEKPLESGVASAWQRSLDQFGRAGIDVSQTPLYLVLGSPAGGIRDFFTAGHTDLAVLPSAEEANDPIQVCGNRDAIYVCCREASLLGNFTRRAAQSRILTHGSSTASSQQTISRTPAQDWRDGSAAASLSTGGGSVPQSPSFPETAGASSAVAVAAPPVTMAEVAPADHPAVQRVHETMEQLQVLTEVETEVKPEVVLQPRKAKLPLLQLEPVEAEELLSRLDGLCREIAEIRQPFCPINGVLLMIPLDAAESIETADHVGMRIERDLSTIASATESSVSVQAVFCDLELCEGGSSFLDRFPHTQRHRRLGAILPAPPASEPEAGPAGIDKAVRWICDQLFPPLAYRLMNRDVKDSAHDRAARLDNQYIHTLVESMRQRREGMSRMLRRAIASAAGRVRIRGCFVAATGASGESKKAFTEGIMPLILDIQNEVQWTAARRNRDAWQRRLAVAIYATVVVTAVATSLLILNIN